MGKILVGFLFLAFTSLSSLFAEELRIVAVVNDEVITETELERALAPITLQLQSEYGPEELAAKAKEIRKGILQQLIEEKLLLREARNPRPVEVSKGKIGTPPPIPVLDSEIEEMVEEIKGRFESPEAFAEALSQQGLGLEDLRNRYKDQLTIQKLIDREIRSRITVSPAEVTAYYGVHQEEFVVPPAVQVAAILIQPKPSLDLNSARERALSLLKELKEGADFYDLASRYSDGPNPKMGGRLGFIEKGKSLQEVDEALFKLKAGEISPVIRTAMGFYIFKAESVRPERRANPEEVQGKIQHLIFQEKAAARFKEWLERLKADAYISIR